MNIETKIRNIRFLGELAKFKVAPPGLIFSCLKVRGSNLPRISLITVTLFFTRSYIFSSVCIYIPPEMTYKCLFLMTIACVIQCCLDDFTHHNIDVACNLLETCGRFLYRSTETSLRMGNMLEIIMRLKNVKNLDARHSTLVENAYYQCKPPERSARVSKVRPPLHQVMICFRF